VTDKKQTLRRM